MVRRETWVTKRASEDDRRIGLRIAYARGWRNIKQSALASRVGLTRAQLSTIEAGRVALRLQAGWKICTVLDVHPSWLRTGHWPDGKELPFPPSDHPMMTRVEQYVKANKTSLFSESWPRIAWLLSTNALPIGKKQLTDASTAGIAPDVKSQLDGLLAQLNRVTKEPGKKSELAAFLGAPLASVSRWLSGEREPGGETTLRLLRWIELQKPK